MNEDIHIVLSFLPLVEMTKKLFLKHCSAKGELLDNL